MDFSVLFGGAFVPLTIILVMVHPETSKRLQRLFWLLPVAASNIFFALAYVSAHRWGRAGAIWWQCAGFAALLTSTVIYLCLPKSQRES